MLLISLGSSQSKAKLTTKDETESKVKGGRPVDSCYSSEKDRTAVCPPHGHIPHQISVDWRCAIPEAIRYVIRNLRTSDLQKKTPPIVKHLTKRLPMSKIYRADIFEEVEDTRLDARASRIGRHLEGHFESE